MNKEQVKEIFKHLKTSYPSYSFKPDMIEYWEKELTQYDYEDIMIRLRELMSDERYAYQPPLLEAITRGITKKHNKVDFSELTYFCMFCRRPFNDRKEYEEHQDRCRSIKYGIEYYYKRFNLGIIDNNKKRELYELSEEEFDRQYKIILKYVMQHTDDESERTRIGFIFNPPSQEQARKFLNE